MSDSEPVKGYTPAPGTSLVTQADRWQWQRQGARELAAILDAHPDLPQIGWQLGHIGGLVGEVICLGVPPEEARATFTAWQHALGIEDVREAPLRDTGIVSLAGHTHHGVVRVGLVARVYYPLPDDEPSEASAPTPAAQRHQHDGTQPARVRREPTTHGDGHTLVPRPDGVQGGPLIPPRPASGLGPVPRV